MKIVVLHNVDINNFSREDELYLSGARVTYAITKSNHTLMSESVTNRKNVIFLMWNDRVYNNESQTWDEKLSPSPIDRICDFIRDIWTGPKSEVEYLCNIIKQMRMGETLHYDVEGYTFDVRNLDKYNK